ncbi:MAG: hydroxymethylbilane synthase [Planctomycetota bacterium]|jgi:hydroxymethylbilane synthase|nr:hydroxymethylbilane synthase [Planctomycetota bacterium]
MTTPFRLATRASPLAMWQARHVAALLRAAWPGLPIEIHALTSSGDQDLETPLYGMGNVGVFAREVHAAVLNGTADVAVHSCKDLPTTAPTGIAAPVICKRHDPRDALIGATSIDALPQGTLVGSSSLRRRSQLAALRPDLRFTSIRGNVQTRLGKVAAGEVGATILACAGLSRMGLMRQARARGLDPHHELIPAPAQGALALDHRCGDTRSAVLLSPLRHHDTARAVTIEREVLAGLRGGCSLPLGCYAVRAGVSWQLEACLDSETGIRRVSLQGHAATLPQRCLDALFSAP